MTNKEIVFTALTNYFVDLSTKNEVHNLETIEKIDKLINYLKK